MSVFVQSVEIGYMSQYFFSKLSFYAVKSVLVWTQLLGYIRFSYQSKDPKMRALLPTPDFRIRVSVHAIAITFCRVLEIWQIPSIQWSLWAISSMVAALRCRRFIIRQNNFIMTWTWTLIFAKFCDFKVKFYDICFAKSMKKFKAVRIFESSIWDSDKILLYRFNLRRVELSVSLTMKNCNWKLRRWHYGPRRIMDRFKIAFKKNLFLEVP